MEENNMSCCISITELYRMFDYRYNYRKECVIKDILEDLEDGINIDMFEIRDGVKIYCNVEGAAWVADSLGINFDIYRGPISFLNSCNLLTEDKIPLELDIYLEHETFEDFNNVEQEVINKYLSYKCSSMCLLGKRIEDIDQNLLSNRDRSTINSCIGRYNDEAKNGQSQSYRLLSAYDYVNTHDPDIVVRSLYNFDYEEIDIDEEIQKLNHMNFNNVFKYFDADVKKLENIEKKNKKKNKNKKKKK